MMANEEKMEQKQEGRKHNLKVFVIMIPLLIVMETKVSQHAIDAFHHKPFCCSESTHKENKNIQQGGKKYGDV